MTEQERQGHLRRLRESGDEFMKSLADDAERRGMTPLEILDEVLDDAERELLGFTRPRPYYPPDHPASWLVKDETK